MSLLVLILVVVIILLAADDVRMRMDNGRHKMVDMDGDSVEKLSVDGDTIYPQPLPDSLIEQGTDWSSDNVDTSTDAS